MRHNSALREYSPAAGTSIGAACRDLAMIAEATCHATTMVFNGIQVIANPGDAPESLIAKWTADADARSAAYADSPEGKAAAAAAAKRRAQAAVARREGIVEFDIADRDAWNEYVAAQNDEYGQGILRFAARWAAAMEHELAAGKQLADIVDNTEREADKEGITGLMVLIATTILVRVWAHGPALAAWREQQENTGKDHTTMEQEAE